MGSSIKEALLQAVKNVGEEIATAAATKRKERGLPVDRHAPRGIIAYLEWVSRDHPTIACALLSRIMPQQQQTEVRVEHTYQTMEEIGNRLRELGLEPRRIFPLIEAKPEPDKVN